MPYLRVAATALSFALVIPGGASADAGVSTSTARGCSWSVEVTGRRGWEFDDVDALSAHNAWAAGVEESDGSEPENDVVRPLIKHWDGGSWTRVKVPPLRGYTSLSAIDALTADDVWAVGSRTIRGRSGFRQVYLHWNGAGWREVAAPAHDRGVVIDVAAVSHRDVWAVGWDHGDHSLMIRIWHWNGARWSRAPAPRVPGDLESVDLVRGHVVAAGYDYSSASPSAALLLTWTGNDWRRVPIDGAIAPAGGISSIGGRWLVGDRPVEGSDLPWVVRRTGDGWTSLPVDGLDTQMRPYAVAETETGEGWAVGYRYIDGEEPSDQWAIVHGDASGWSDAPLPTGFETAEGRLTGITAVPGADTLLAVGLLRREGYTRPVMLRGC